MNETKTKWWVCGVLFLGICASGLSAHAEDSFAGAETQRLQKFMDGYQASKEKVYEAEAKIEFLSAKQKQMEADEKQLTDDLEKKKIKLEKLQRDFPELADKNTKEQREYDEEKARLAQLTADKQAVISDLAHATNDWDAAKGEAAVYAENNHEARKEFREKAKEEKKIQYGDEFKGETVRAPFGWYKSENKTRRRLDEEAKRDARRYARDYVDGRAVTKKAKYGGTEDDAQTSASSAQSRPKTPPSVGSSAPSAGTTSLATIPAGDHDYTRGWRIDPVSGQWYNLKFWIGLICPQSRIRRSG